MVGGAPDTRLFAAHQAGEKGVGGGEDGLVRGGGLG